MVPETNFERALDCHSIDSALTSLGNLFRTPKRELKDALLGFSFDSFRTSRDRALEPPPRVLWNRIVGINTQTPIPEVTYWFHATRVNSEADFKEGIQPLNARLPKIHEFLDSLARGAGLSSPSPATFHYALKTSDPIHWGPYAFLVLDAILRPCEVTHNYLATPEIVEDIAGNSQIVIDEFRKRTRPCIVKFRSAQPREDVVEVALYYCYFSLWCRDMNLDTNTHFDGKGRTIPFKDIVGIDYPQQNENLNENKSL
jgi:hypothetical protein